MAGEKPLMASVLYGCLRFPPRASFLASLEKSAVYLSHMQASHPRPALKNSTEDNTRLSTINQTTALGFPGGASGKEPTCHCR